MRLPVVSVRLAANGLGGRRAGILLLSGDSDGEEGKREGGKSSDLHVVGVVFFFFFKGVEKEGDNQLGGERCANI